MADRPGRLADWRIAVVGREWYVVSRATVIGLCLNYNVTAYEDIYEHNLKLYPALKSGLENN